MTTPVVSIVICTRDRADSLAGTLASVGRCEVPEHLPTELIVVDNGSTDRTQEIIAAARITNMTCRTAVELRKGLCNARNRGLQDARGRVLLYTDDDVRVPVAWIDGMCSPLAADAADVVCGGVSLPAGLRQPWMSPMLKAMIAITEQQEASGRPMTVGANMAFRRRVLEVVPFFDPELDPGALGYGGDSLFGLQLQAAGLRFVARWNVRVEHHLDPARLTYENYCRMASNMGRSIGFINYHWRHAEVPSQISEYVAAAKLVLRRLLSARGTKRVPRDWEMAYMARLSECRQFRIEARRERKYDRFGPVPRGIRGSGG